jgi:hypothetical protein
VERRVCVVLVRVEVSDGNDEEGGQVDLNLDQFLVSI